MVEVHEDDLTLSALNELHDLLNCRGYGRLGLKPVEREIQDIVGG